MRLAVRLVIVIVIVVFVLSPMMLEPQFVSVDRFELGDGKIVVVVVVVIVCLWFKANSSINSAVRRILRLQRCPS